MWISLLALGFLLGLKHALEADHVAAVASLATRAGSLRETLRVSGAWGVGHASTLFVFGAVLVLLGVTVAAPVAHALEGLVGVMLVVLGVAVLRRLRRARVHAHVHRHGDAAPHLHLHLHLHAHAGETAGEHTHDHAHGRAFVPRALLVGCVHGLAGTAGLVLLAGAAMDSTARTLAYLGLFGLGTVAGMMLFSVAISVPLVATAGRLRRAGLALDAVLGTANLGLGAWIAARSLGGLLG